jgi:hypothetical protein
MRSSCRFASSTATCSSGMSTSSVVSGARSNRGRNPRRRTRRGVSRRVSATREPGVPRTTLCTRRPVAERVCAGLSRIQKPISEHDPHNPHEPPEEQAHRSHRASLRSGVVKPGPASGRYPPLRSGRYRRRLAFAAGSFGHDPERRSPASLRGSSVPVCPPPRTVQADPVAPDPRPRPIEAAPFDPRPHAFMYPSTAHLTPPCTAGWGYNQHRPQGSPAGRPPITRVSRAVGSYI